MKLRRILAIILITAASYILMGSACSNYTNFTTYFNTFYNMERLTYEAEEEFEFQEEKRRVQPRVFVPQPEIFVSEETTMGPPAFLTEFIVSKQKRQPVQVKLDSIIIKGSKILARKGKSDYVEGSLWLMAKSFFYQEDWLNSQLKCSELVDKFPDGDLSPDAHLLYTKNLLIQRKFLAGEVMLSRTVDIAWQKKRYDILSEAFRIEAELALLNNDHEKALRPYRNAISQTDDGKIKARWQLDMAALLFRIHRFEAAEAAFRLVHRYSPEYIQKFEAYLYQAASLGRLKRYDEADEILRKLERDGKYEEWIAHTKVQQLQIARLKWLDTNYVPNQDEVKYTTEELAKFEKTVDSAYSNNPALLTYYYEKGQNYYDRNDYVRARSMFAKARVTRTPVFKTAEKMFQLMNTWDLKQKAAEPLLAKLKSDESEVTDSTRLELCSHLYAIGRIHEELDNKDSVEYYFKLAVDNAPLRQPESSQYYYSYSRIMKEKDAFLADSLLEIIVMNHPLTEFGKDAQLQLGYTSNFVIDTVAELYTSGLNLMRHGDYNYSIDQFSKVYFKYPNSKYTPASVYTIGWIYERYLRLPDSALAYYKILLDEYPETEHAKEVNLGVAYKMAVNTGEIPDSLKEREVVFPPKPVTPEKGKIKPERKPPVQKPNALDPKQLLKDPASILKSAESLISDPVEMLKDIEFPPKLIENPDDMILESPSQTPTPPDSNTFVVPQVQEPKK
ncbi:MAG: tetratricopeptide repeat protein [Candidatus Kapabacteria bacterium]|nr:tetratricopeptide repeat protein [Ignavibacteriota bacterium]MCW5884714.1 tetratricopeptide repeat protein [Candidatus Kapabacteria bacterium]